MRGAGFGDIMQEIGAFFLYLLAIAVVFCLRFEKARKDCVKEGLIHS